MPCMFMPLDRLCSRGKCMHLMFIGLEHSRHRPPHEAAGGFFWS